MGLEAVIHSSPAPFKPHLGCLYHLKPSWPLLLLPASCPTSTLAASPVNAPISGSESKALALLFLSEAQPETGCILQSPQSFLDLTLLSRRQLERNHVILLQTVPCLPGALKAQEP